MRFALKKYTWKSHDAVLCLEGYLEDTMQRCDYADVFPSRGDEDGGMVANFAHIDTGRQTWK